MSKRRRSVQSVVAITLVTVTTLLLGSFATGTYIRERDKEYERLRGQAMQIAERGAAALALPVWNIDRDQVDQIVESGCNSPSVEMISVEAAGMTKSILRNGDGRCVASPRTTPPPDTIAETHNIELRGERIGTISVYVSPKLIDAQLRDTLLWTILSILLVDAFIVFFVYLVLWITVLEPLAQIERYAVAFTEGDVHPKLELAPVLTSDLANLRRSIQRMVQLQESLRRTEALSSMGRLVGGVAHEIRNPLFGITALLDAYESEMDERELGEFSRGVREAVSRLTSLTRELLEYGRPARVSLDPGPVTAVIDEAVRSRAALAANCGVIVKISAPEALPEVAMDRDRLSQAFGNLIDNAIRHSPRGGAVTVMAAAVDATIECRVEDQGSGFAPADIAQAFEPFYSRRSDGTGLGLSIVERVIGEHHGSVMLTNTPNGGACVCVRLPVPITT